MYGEAAAIAACEMPLAAASRLKLASQGSKLPVLRQLGCASATVGASSKSIAATAQIIVRIVMVRSCHIVRSSLRVSARPTRSGAPRARGCLLAQCQLAYPDRGAA